MLQKIIVGFDASPASIDAAEWAIGLAAPAAGSVLLAHTPHDDELIAASGDRVQDVANALVPPAGSVRASAHVEFVSRPGDPDGVLADLCRETDSDLLVLGADEDDDLAAHLSFGLLEQAGTPLAVVPIGTPPPLPGTGWVVQVDGSPAGTDALQWAADAAEQTGGAVHPLFTYDPTADSFPHPAEEAWTYPGEMEARQQLGQVDSRRVQELQRLPGGPGMVLRDVATQLDLPAVVVTGTGGGRSLGRLGVDRPTAALLDHSPCAVVLVPAAGDVDSPAAEPELLEDGARSTVVRATDVAQASAIVHDAERAGDEASSMHIEGAALPPTTGRMQRNDRANIAVASRPAALTALAGALLLGGVILVICLVAGAGSLITLLLTIAGVIAGGVLGALAGLYSHLTINRDVIDLRGQEETTGVVVREQTDASGRPVPNDMEVRR